MQLNAPSTINGIVSLQHIKHAVEVVLYLSNVFYWCGTTLQQYSNNGPWRNKLNVQYEKMLHKCSFEFSDNRVLKIICLKEINKHLFKITNGCDIQRLFAVHLLITLISILPSWQLLIFLFIVLNSSGVFTTLYQACAMCSDKMSCQSHFCAFLFVIINFLLHSIVSAVLISFD